MADEIKIAAVLVLYEQELSDSNTYQSLLKDSELPVLVYDNSLANQKIEEILNFDYRHNPKNPGVSAAYNEAINWAQNKSFTHLLLLDSDSVFPEKAIDKYREAALEFSNQLILPTLISADRKISPFYFSNGKTHYGEGIKQGRLELGKQLPINAGALLPLNKLNGVRFNEKLRLDWSDIYFFRHLSRTRIQAQHISLEIQHGLSEHEIRSLSSAQLRFETYMKGISEVGEGRSEKMLMYFWAKLRALKLCLQYRSFWFFTQYLKQLNG